MLLLFVLSLVVPANAFTDGYIPLRFGADGQAAANPHTAASHAQYLHREYDRSYTARPGHTIRNDRRVDVGSLFYGLGTK